MASSTGGPVDDGGKQVQCAYDHFWRYSVHLRLKDNRLCGRASHDLSICSNSCVLQRFLLDELNSIPLRSTLTFGAGVKVVCGDGIYRNAKILGQGQTARGSLLYEDWKENSQSLVPTWKCEVDMESGPDIQEHVHMSQMRPLLQRCVTTESVHERTTVWLNRERTDWCTAIRRGDTAVTDDRVQHVIVVNDVELMLLFDDQCNVINYQQVVAVTTKSIETKEEPCLSVFGNHMTCVLRSLTLFETTTLAGNDNDCNETIDLSNQHKQLTANLAEVDAIFQQPQTELATLEAKCCDVDAKMTAEEYAHKQAAQEQMLQDFVNQKEKVTSSVEELDVWMRNVKDDSQQSLCKGVKIRTDIAVAMRRMEGVCEQAKNRHEALLVQRHNFHEEILADVNQIKNSFDAIATRMEAQFQLNHDDETIQNVLDLLREIKIIASGDCNNGKQALGLLSQIRDALSAIRFTDPTAIPTTAQQTSDAVTAVAATSSLTTATVTDTASKPTNERPAHASADDIVVVVTTDEEETAAESESGGKRKRKTEVGSPAATRLRKKSKDNEYLDDSKSHTTTVRRPIRATPKYKKHQTQAAIQIRRWGDNLPVEVKFDRNFVFLTRTVREKAANLVGGGLPTNAKYYEIVRHVTSYCKFIVNAIIGTDRGVVVILLPKPDDTDEDTVERMMVKQSAAIQHAVKCYQEAFKPPDTNHLLQAMKHFVTTQKEQFLKGRSELENVVKDQKMLSHLD